MELCEPQKIVIYPLKMVIFHRNSGFTQLAIVFGMFTVGRFKQKLSSHALRAPPGGSLGLKLKDFPGTGATFFILSVEKYRILGLTVCS